MKYKEGDKVRIVKERTERMNSNGEMDRKIMKFDIIQKPVHYNKGKIEVIEVIEDWKLGFNLGNVIKYIGRSESKGNKQENLEKALWYLKREIEQMFQ